MKPIRACVVAGIMFASILGATACARECAPEVRDGWIRMPPMAMPMLAGFGQVENRCDTAITIVGVSSPSFADTSLHETRIADGISRMRPIQKLRIAAGDAATLQPGGLHLMLMQPKTPLAATDTVLIEFVLEDGRRLRGEFVLRKPGD